MARPVNADAQATQAKILATAYDLFAARGIDGASVRDIAKGASVSLAMVHHYFGSKQGLYEACIDAMLKELGGLRSELEAKLALNERPPIELLSEAVRIGYRFAREHRKAVRLLQRSLVDTGELDARVREKNVVPFLDNVSQVLGGITSRPSSVLRLPIQSVVFLVVRYAITSDRELAALVGDAAIEHTPRSDASAAAVAVEEHLVEASLNLLGMHIASA
ncbi:MAG: TetR/AcrR family transcriptional regulator [Polyangiaceae bacterium]|nr:TetR/AcrR family transcriptional regulator [Polyangiaceae bacterium]